MSGRTERKKKKNSKPIEGESPFVDDRPNEESYVIGRPTERALPSSLSSPCFSLFCLSLSVYRGRDVKSCVCVGGVGTLCLHFVRLDLF